ncbi:hypothetical protein FB45DRAFT_1037809 [Roridomyces roridus]|uniref:Uncharacterized protein n=1 Tax=Roridomyces roridus TaxID=1738132 RepID=A0AAD7B5T9_9AGAR|nr:hypothetical protein FB45DRAFT_1037809 [Roridomyces roridus]
MSKLLFTHSTEGDMRLTNYLAYQDSSDPANKHLYEMGEIILDHYRTVLSFLSTRTTTPPCLRLQTAFAAAVFCISEDELSNKGPDELARMRGLACNLFSPFTAPPLILYIGKERSPSLQSPPLTSVSSVLADDAEEFESWAEEWDAMTGPWPCQSGLKWQTEPLDRKNSFIFISGSYVIWPKRWTPPQLMAESHRLLRHLQVTLYRELVHASRSAVYGQLNSSRTIGDFGDIGRYAERLAFGGLVEMDMNDCEITLFTTDPVMPLGEGGYYLSEDQVDGLFGSDVRPINFTYLAAAKQHARMPDYVRSTGA